MHRRAFLQIVEMHVSIDCDGCEDNVRKALEKLKGARIVQFFFASRSIAEIYMPY